MPTPAIATLSQGQKLLDLVKGATSQQMQNLLENGDLTKIMLDVDLSKVDRSAFKSVLAPAPEPIPWTPVSEYVDRIMARSQLRGWGFNQTDANRLRRDMYDHNGPLSPTGVSLWLGKGLEHNWFEMLMWLSDEVGNLGLGLQSSFGPADLNFRRGSHKAATYRIAGVVDFDLARFWEPRDGLVVRDNLYRNRMWPGLDVAILLALNPQVAALMDGVTFPYLLAAGLTVDSGIPVFSCLDGRIYVTGQSRDGLWTTVSMVDYNIGR